MKQSFETFGVVDAVSGSSPRTNSPNNGTTQETPSASPPNQQHSSPSLLTNYVSDDTVQTLLQGEEEQYQRQHGQVSPLPPSHQYDVLSPPYLLYNANFLGCLDRNILSSSSDTQSQQELICRILADVSSIISENDPSIFRPIAADNNSCGDDENREGTAGSSCSCASFCTCKFTRQ